jgi:alkanesulfonate monooxygenase SsuD/methylene tetrahydromethanopterin reductase-like flavin-dependent oxidoreductase (luciferase family)
VGQDRDAWTLHRRCDGRLVAHLVVTGGDFPWLNARVEPGDGFDELRPVFAEELRRVQRIDDDVPAWDRAYDAVRAAVTLRYPDGQDVPEFILHLDGEQAWWRWSDEPFEDEP